MKKLLVIAVCLGFIISSTAAYAAPVGNIATPSLLKKGLIIKDEQSQYGVIAGGEVDLNWDRKLKNQVDDTEYYFYGGKIGILLMDRFIPYTVLGAAEAKKQNFKVGAYEVEWKTDYDFVWAVGGTALIYSTQPGQLGEGVLSFGVDGRYRQSHLSVDAVKLNGINYDHGSSSLTNSKYELGEWQIAGELAYQYKQIIPYFGVKYSDASGEAEATINSRKYKNDFEGKDNVGIFAGGDIAINDSFTANIEGRFLDETALSIAANFRF